jgi:hypothetical protein
MMKLDGGRVNHVEMAGMDEYDKLPVGSRQLSNHDQGPNFTPGTQSYVKTCYIEHYFASRFLRSSIWARKGQACDLRFGDELMPRTNREWHIRSSSNKKMHQLGQAVTKRALRRSTSLAM